jgi:hypothetical protein
MINLFLCKTLKTQKMRRCKTLKKKVSIIINRINIYDKKNKKSTHFLKKPNFTTIKLQIGIFWSKLNGFSYFFFL